MEDETIKSACSVTDPFIDLRGLRQSVPVDGRDFPAKQLGRKRPKKEMLNE